MPEISSPITGEFVATKKVPIKAALDLGNVDNTSDANKPVSTLQAAADDAHQAAAEATAAAALAAGLLLKSDAGHGHDQDEITGLVAALAGKIASSIAQGGTGSIAITNLVAITESDYNLLGAPNADTLYLLIEP